MQVFALAIWLASAPMATPVDEWVMHTDGRVGGCYRTGRGRLYSCTPQPEVVVPPEDQTGPEPTPESDASEELRVVKLELEQLKLRESEDDARREQEQAERDAVERATRSADQRDNDAAMAAYNAIESAKDSVHLQQLGAKTEACRSQLEARGYKIMGPGACKAQNGVYLNCPEC